AAAGAFLLSSVGGRQGGPVYAGFGPGLPGGRPVRGPGVTPAKEKKPWQPSGLSCCLGRPRRLVPFWRRAQPSPLGAEGGLQELREQGQAGVGVLLLPDGAVQPAQGLAVLQNGDPPGGAVLAGAGLHSLQGEDAP